MERPLFDRFHAALVENGVRGYDRQALGEDYRLPALWQATTPIFLRLPYRSMLAEQGFVVIYEHVSKLQPETFAGVHARCPQCKGSGRSEGKGMPAVRLPWLYLPEGFSAQIRKVSNFELMSAIYPIGEWV
jgi:hypothetical protein